MTTELESPPISDEEHLAQVMQEARNAIESRIRNLDLCEGLLRKLPRKLREKAHISDNWMNFYNCNHEDAVEIMRCLSLGRWNRKLNDHLQTKVDYSTRHEGFLIQIWGSEPPSSCQIVEEEIEVPAHKETIRRLICA